MDAQTHELHPLELLLQLVRVLAIVCDIRKTSYMCSSEGIEVRQSGLSICSLVALVLAGGSFCGDLRDVTLVVEKRVYLEVILIWTVIVCGIA